MTCLQNLLSRTALCLLAFVLVSELSTVINAQVVNATLSGRVTDSSGASVPGATVSAINSSTGIARTTSTTADGLYNLPYLDPGTYQVEIETRGFKKFARTGVVLGVSTTSHIDATLEPGNVTETVTVTGEPPVLQTDSAGSPRTSTPEPLSTFH